MNAKDILDSLKSKEELDSRFSSCDKLIVPDSNNLNVILSNIKELIFQGFHSLKSQQQLLDLINETSNLLNKEIFNAIVFFNSIGNINCDDSYAIDISKKITEEFFKSLSKIQNMLLEDVKATFEGDPAALSYDEIIMFYPGLYATFAYRIAHQLDLLNVPYLPKMISSIAKEKTAIDIHPCAIIKEGLMIDHGVGVVIGSTCEIGKNVKIYQGVTLGALSTKNREQLKNKKRHPSIEDNVTIYANATILGGDTVIKKGSTIGGNVFLINSVDENTTVILKKQDYLYK